MALLTLRNFWILSVVLSLILRFVHQDVVLHPIEFQPRDLSGETYLVTGTTVGSIGAETARALATWNATVILGVRSEQKGLKAKESIERSIFNDMDCTGRVEVITGLDLNARARVREFVAKLGDRPLHGLINNAGMTTLSETGLSEDGDEMTFAVNHLNPFLLTRLLEPNLVAGAHAGGVAGSGKARVVFVSSIMHYAGKVDQEMYGIEFKGMHPTISRSGLLRYGDTKLMNLLTAVEMDARNSHSGKPIVVNAVHPGYVISALDQHMEISILKDIAVALRENLGRDTVSGSVTQVTVASSEKLNDVQGGKYFEDRCIDNFCQKCIYCIGDGAMGVTPSAAAQDDVLRAWLWDTSSVLVGL